MNREQLADFVRGAAPITVDGDIVIIGSQSILGAADVGQLPEEATMSMEADVAFRDDIDASKADAVDGAIGELSQLHETYGNYVQGWEQTTGPESSTAPSDSAEALRCEDLALLAGSNSSQVNFLYSGCFPVACQLSDRIGTQVGAARLGWVTSGSSRQRPRSQGSILLPILLAEQSHVQTVAPRRNTPVASPPVSRRDQRAPGTKLFRRSPTVT